MIYRKLKINKMVYDLGIIIVLFLTCQPTYLIAQTNNTVQQAYENIVGTWVSTESEDLKWKITESKIKWYYKGNNQGVFIYTISRADNQCGYDVSKRLQKYEWESILKLINTENGKEHCYYLTDITYNHMSINNFESSDYVFFEKNN